MTPQKEIVIVTGSGGFIGGALVAALAGAQPDRWDDRGGGPAGASF